MKSTLHKKKSRTPGLSPGTLPPDNNETEKAEIQFIYYESNILEERILNNVDDCYDYKNRSGVSWINVEGKLSSREMEKIGVIFNLHPLQLEDIACGGHRPKVEAFEEYLFIVVKMLHYDKELKEIKAEQVSLVLGKNYVVSIQNEGIEGDVFNPNRERLRSNKGKIRKAGADYLVYTLIDTIVDNYYSILEAIEEELEDMEMQLITNPTPDLLRAIYRQKREIIILRKSVWPLREVINRLERDDFNIIQPETKVFLRDIYDHTIHVIETVESYRDIVAGMLDIYLSSISNKMNTIMKVLTIISTIFIPLTFIVGVYGMNFKYMPELQMKYSYYVVWGIMFFIVISMVSYFKKKNWL